MDDLGLTPPFPVESLLTVPVHVTNYTEVAAKVAALIAEKKRPATSIVQTNVYTLVNAQEDPEYRGVFDDGVLSVPDGMPLVWMLRSKGHPIKDRVYGPDLMLFLCDAAAKRNWRCFLYGGLPGVAEELRLALIRKFPALNIVGSYSPPFRELTPEEDSTVCKIINAARPDIVWVGLGSPKQDLWMHDHRTRVDAAVLHGVGAAFDFLSGRVKQAPRWMMRMGLEWLYRLSAEPGRLWRRYTFTNLKFIFYVVRHSLFKV
jgi:N-acetylglucosaminyldiphosphoundecaprenol N-acetyl-beta-D-mannosaminyltransferase